VITTENRTRRDERIFSEIKRLSAANLEGPELLRRVAKRLSKAVPFEAYCASTVDPASRLITYGIAEGMGGKKTLNSATSTWTASTSRKICP
jgi:hypothetical protein